MSGRYDDILPLPHHVSATRPQMSMLDRAAQFSPFAALTGYEDTIRETARWTGAKRELSEEEKERLDRKQQSLLRQGNRQPPLAVTYFVADGKKAGGRYVTKVGRLKRLDPYGRRLVLTDGTKIPLADVVGLESPPEHGRS